MGSVIVKKPRGGARPGAGAPRLVAGQTTESVQIRLDPARKAMAMAIGDGNVAKGVREAIDKLTCCEGGECAARAAGWMAVAEMYRQAAGRFAGKDYRRGNAEKALADAEWDKMTTSLLDTTCDR